MRLHLHLPSAAEEQASYLQAFLLSLREPEASLPFSLQAFQPSFLLSLREQLLPWALLLLLPQELPLLFQPFSLKRERN